MGTVCRTERIVDEDVAVGCESLGEGWVVALLTGVEANVLEQKQFAWSQSANSVVGSNTERITGGWDVHTNELRESLSRGSQAQAVHHAAIRSAKVRHDHDGCAAIEECLNRRHRRADA